ncbi:MAG: hypothetical protein Q7S84_02500, partial [bacterium]|nr:hypothetical protein [bacterium]
MPPTIVMIAGANTNGNTACSRRFLAAAHTLRGSPLLLLPEEGAEILTPGSYSSMPVTVDL